MKLELTTQAEGEFFRSERFEALSEEGKHLSNVTFNTLDSRFCGKYLPTVTLGGAGTDPRFRRQGAIREMFNTVLNMGPERGWAVAMLHPFSTAYYRMFGFEKICDHKILKFELATLRNIPRCPDFKKLWDDAPLEDVLQVYNRFGDKRNIMFRRFDDRRYPKDVKAATYVWYDGAGNPASYISLWGEKYYNVNRNTPVALHVEELVFTTPESLKALFGFMRMFEGEQNTAIIHNCAMAPEVDLILREYVEMAYTLVPDIMARILDVKAVLEANPYPDAPGQFRIWVEDSLEFTRGLWQVTYENGKGHAERIPDSNDWDLKLPMPAFTQVVYGYEAHTADSAAYLEGAELKNDCRDFFRAFGKKYNGLFEHF